MGVANSHSHFLFPELYKFCGSKVDANHLQLNQCIVSVVGGYSMANRLIKKLSEIDKAVANLVATGTHSSEIAEMLGYSEYYILEIQHRLRKFYGTKNTIGLMVKLRQEGYGLQTA